MQGEYIYQVVRSDVSKNGTNEIRHTANYKTALTVAKKLVALEYKELGIKESPLKKQAPADSNDKEGMLNVWFIPNTYISIFIFQRLIYELPPELLKLPLTTAKTPITKTARTILVNPSATV